MQTIAGIHYNLSFPSEFWQAWQQASQNNQDPQEFINEKYFALIRNFQRHSFLLLYLLGCKSCGVCLFLIRPSAWLSQFKCRRTLSTYATSLRMSRLGYQNTVQRDLQVSYNHLPDYIDNLSNAIHALSPFADIGVKPNGVYQQMNANVCKSKMNIMV